MPALIIAAILYLTLMLTCGRYTARFAAQRGRSKATWFLLGALFYPVPYLVLALLPPDGRDGGDRTPLSTKRGPAGVPPKSQTETLPGPRQDTTGYTRGGLMAVAGFE